MLSIKADVEQSMMMHILWILALYFDEMWHVHKKSSQE